MSKQEMTPVSGDQICRTRKGLNDTLGRQFQTVSDLVQTVVEWRKALGVVRVDDDKLEESAASARALAVDFFRAFSSWRQAHAMSELGNFTAEDMTEESLTAYDDLRLPEKSTFNTLREALAAFAANHEVVLQARIAFMVDQVDEDEAAAFASLESALAGARTALEATAEARIAYYEQADAYSEQRQAAFKQKAKCEDEPDGDCEAE